MSDIPTVTYYAYDGTRYVGQFSGEDSAVLAFIAAKGYTTGPKPLASDRDLWVSIVSQATAAAEAAEAARDSVKGWTGGSYNASTGIVTFTSDDGLGFVTGDLRGSDGTNGTNGTDGTGWTGGSYNASTGVITFTSDDGLGFTTDDLRGADGTDGTDGVSFTWEGAWITSTAYALNDVVENDGSSYICISAHTASASDEPGVGVNTATYWELVAQAGADGAGAGTVTSIDITGGTGITSTGGPVTSSGAITVALDSATQTSLALADSALQSADIGTTVQAYDAGLTSIAGLTTAADKMVYTTASDTYAVADLTSFARTLLDDADASAARTTLGVDAAGTDNSTDVTLAGTPDYLTIAGQVITRNPIDLTTDVTGDLPVADGGTGASTASAARTNLGLVIGTDVQAFDADILKADTHDTLTAGFDSDEEALGTITSGTVTPEVDGANKENFKSLTNNGAFTLAPPSTSSACCIRIHVINAASAGAITTTGFDKVFDPDTYATTNAKEYFFYIDHTATRDVLTIREIV